MKVNHKSMVKMLVCVALVSVLAASFLPAVSAGPKKPLAKNVIVMISDGWGYNQIAATDYYQYGQAGVQLYEEFPVRYAMSTYMDQGSYDPDAAWNDFYYFMSGATDSAAAATTMSTGIKTHSGAIGVGPDGSPLTHVMQLAEDLGKATGVVSSVEFSHATPAGFVAHNVSRNNYVEIANEMIYSSHTDVIMGAGNPCFDNDGNYTGKYGDQGQFTYEGCGSESKHKYVGGTATWADLKDGTVTGGDGQERTVIQTREEFQDMMGGDTPDRVIGIPHAYKTLQYNRSAVDVPCYTDEYGNEVCEEPYPYWTDVIETVPTLEEMTKAALNVLDNDKDGFMLMVEGGAVDWAGHGNSSARVIEEQIDFNHAVEAAIDWVRANSNWGETLLIVTGDHETGYLTGPGSNPDWMPVVNNGAGNQPGMEWHSGSHTNQLIPFFAKGDAARQFRHAADGWDPIRGSYLDNVDLGKALFYTIDPSYSSE
jgi:alkaline phosphatase